MSDDHATRMKRSRRSLEGLSVGDAFGETFFLTKAIALERIKRRILPSSPWHYTDDTAMAACIIKVLNRHHRIDQDELARTFAVEFQRDPWRGYGSGAITLLQRISLGESRRDVSPSLFHGQGAYGNGVAMRITPLGAYLADDPAEAARQARLSAEVTHAHPEGQAGAIAIAVAAAFLAGCAAEEVSCDRLFASVLNFTSACLTRQGLEQARELDPETSPQEAAEILGSSYCVSAQDTVPFVIWCAARSLDDFEDGLWRTASGLGDVDTTCAMVGGILATSPLIDQLPPEWLRAREPLESLH